MLRRQIKNFRSIKVKKCNKTKSYKTNSSIFKYSYWFFVYHNKNKPPAMPVSSQIALASRKDLLWYNQCRFGDRTITIPQGVSKMDKNSLAHATCACVPIGILG